MLPVAYLANSPSLCLVLCSKFHLLLMVSGQRCEPAGSNAFTEAARVHSRLRCRRARVHKSIGAAAVPRRSYGCTGTRPSSRGGESLSYVPFLLGLARAY